MSDQTKDSGERRTFVTGSVRDNAPGKGRYDLVSPIALLRLAQLYERGAVKYAARNWEKGQPVTVFMDCAMRHMQKHLAGWRDEDHLAAALWNIAAIIHVEHQCERGKLPAELLDWPASYVTEADANGPVYQPPPAPAPFQSGGPVSGPVPCVITPGPMVRDELDSASRSAILNWMRRDPAAVAAALTRNPEKPA